MKSTDSKDANQSENNQSENNQDGTTRAGSRIVMIGLTILLMASVVFIVGTSLQAEQQSATLSGAPSNDSPSIPVEARTFQRASQALTYLESASNPGAEVDAPRQLTKFQERRAYEGAPPIIPHTVLEEESFGENTCLQCHANGGYSPQFEAYAPVVPHPELISCRSCHVAVQSTDLFDESDWQGLTSPEIHQAALLGSPPPMPHGLQMRENCLACHAGPAAAEEIRVTHPERVNCRQCHVLIETSEEWSR